MRLWSELGWHYGEKSSIMIVETSNGRRGVTLTLADAIPLPVTFAATIEQVYDVPLARPMTVTDGDVAVPVLAPGLQVA